MSVKTFFFLLSICEFSSYQESVVALSLLLDEPREDLVRPFAVALKEEARVEEVIGQAMLRFIAH